MANYINKFKNTKADDVSIIMHVVVNKSTDVHCKGIVSVIVTQLRFNQT